MGQFQPFLEQQPFERSLKTDQSEMAMTFIPFEGSALRPKTDTLLHPSNYYWFHDTAIKVGKLHHTTISSMSLISLYW